MTDVPEWRRPVPYGGVRGDHQGVLHVAGARHGAGRVLLPRRRRAHGRAPFAILERDPLARGDDAFAHGGGAAEERDSWLGFHVSDFDAALAEGGARLVSVVDPEGDAFTLGQDVS